MRTSIWASVGLLSLSMGCLDPLVSDQPGFSPHLAPPDAEIPLVTDSPEIVAKIDASDGIDGGFVPRHSAWAEGESVFYWRFGSTAAVTIPLWSFRRCDEEGEPLPGDAGRTGHPSLIDAVPGDPGYSPYWVIWRVCVTEGWLGEQITSLDALEDAVTLGLILPPRPTRDWFNCPVALPGTGLDVGGETPPVEGRNAYYRGYRVPLFGVGTANGLYELPRGARAVKEGRVYVLEKEGDDAFEEVVFSTPRRMGEENHPNYSPLWRRVRVVVADTYSPGDARSEGDLVRVLAAGERLEPLHPDVLLLEHTDERVNWPIQYEEGRP